MRSRAGAYFAPCLPRLRSCWSSWYSIAEPSPLERTGRLDEKLIPEASGIVKSRRYPGIFWVHNDSGNPPLLFAIRGDGRIVRQFRLDVPNIDWEDIAIDDQGHLYLGDIGNNTGVLPLRAIYRIDEPDPDVACGQAGLAASAVTFYAMPEENRFDAESLFTTEDPPPWWPSISMVAKPSYLPSRSSLRPPCLRPARPRSIGRLPGFTEPATGADLSSDRTLLAVCSSAVTRVYRRDDANSPPWRLLAVVRYASRYRSRESPGTVATWPWSRRAAGFIASRRRPGGPRRLEESLWPPSRPRVRLEVRAAKAGIEMMAEAHDVVIVGGGVIGLSIAFALAREGIRPTVLDRRDLGREASWAGAGLIPPAGENRSRQPLVALRSWSAQLFPALVGRTRAETGIDIGYRRTGGVDVAWTDLEDQELRAAAGRWRVQGIAYERLATRRLRAG